MMLPEAAAELGTRLKRPNKANIIAELRRGEQKDTGYKLSAVQIAARLRKLALLYKACWATVNFSEL